MTLAHQFARIELGGQVTDRIDIGDRTLFIVTAADAYPERLRGTALSRLEATTVDIPAATPA